MQIVSRLILLLSLQPRARFQPKLLASQAEFARCRNYLPLDCLSKIPVFTLLSLTLVSKKPGHADLFLADQTIAH